ncbi:hypothetical protein ISN44_As09g025230 [Arabidopsis suecica]|uniref:Uncharacterized protein n=1 Tax=Arabidopsis suecica TaxID=45249 RepID=A0A8T2ANV0_ARASU|nr:hypothetical protein ISN44_As09g025230 [Arabidopsis suecica]
MYRCLRKVSVIRGKEEQEYSSKTVPVVLPFAKTLKLWEECESTEAFKRRPQYPHFSTSLKVPERWREWYAFAFMQTYLDVSEKFETLGKGLSRSELDEYKLTFLELDKSGFDVRSTLSEIDDLLLSVKDRQANMLNRRNKMVSRRQMNQAKNKP